MDVAVDDPGFDAFLEACTTHPDEMDEGFPFISCSMDEEDESHKIGATPARPSGDDQNALVHVWLPSTAEGSVGSTPEVVTPCPAEEASETPPPLPTLLTPATPQAALSRHRSDPRPPAAASVGSAEERAPRFPPPRGDHPHCKRRRLRHKMRPTPKAVPAEVTVEAAPHGDATSPAGDAAASHAAVRAKALAEFQALKTCAKQRNLWVTLWIQSRPDGYFNQLTSYKAKRQQGNDVWAKQGWEDVREQVQDWSVRGLGSKSRGSPKGNANATRGPNPEIKATAALVNWNVKPCEDPKFKQLFEELKAVDPESADYEELIKKMKALPVVNKGWADFLRFLRKLQAESVFVELSACMELSLHAEEPRWHFHLTVSNIRAVRSDRANGQIVLDKELLDTFAAEPTVRVSTARGRSAEPAVHRLHCYSQWDKVGSLFTLNNFPRGRDFVCKATWTLSAWQVRKLSYKNAKKEIIANRDSVEAALMKLNYVWLAEIEEHMRSEQEKAVLAMGEKLYPFKTIAEVEDWMKFYTPEYFGRLTRFKFLVLVGDSRFGKTRFACNLFGLKATYVCNCQGVTQPYLAGYDPRVHKAIVLDEPSRWLVDACKSFLQAAVDGSELYQSPTQRFTRWVCVYQVPIIICTNEWVKTWEWDANATWIRENEVRIDVEDFLYEKPS